MEFSIDAPDEIKPKIMQKLIQNDILKSVKRKVKMGMMIAVQEIRENKDSESTLERKIFKNANPYELKALQSVFNFLSLNNLSYTLTTLLEESAVKRSNSDTINVMELIDNEINHPEIPRNDYFADEDTRYYEENIETLPKNKQNTYQLPKDNLISSNTIYNHDNYIQKPNHKTQIPYNNINNDKYKLNINEASENNNNNYISSSISNNIHGNYNYSYNNQNYISNPLNQYNPSNNLELQGLKISRSTFERNQFIISIINL